MVLTYTCRNGHVFQTEEWGHMALPCPSCGGDVIKLRLNDCSRERKAQKVILDYYDDALGEHVFDVSHRNKIMKQKGLVDGTDVKTEAEYRDGGRKGTIFSFPTRPKPSLPPL